MSSSKDPAQDPVMREIMGDDQPPEGAQPQAQPPAEETPPQRRARLRKEAAERAAQADQERRAGEPEPGPQPQHRGPLAGPGDDRPRHRFRRGELPEITREQTAERKRDIASRPKANAKDLANDLADFAMRWFEGDAASGAQPTKPDWRLVATALPLAERFLKRRWSREVLGNSR